MTQPGSVTLGRGTTPLIVLEHAPALAPPAGGAAGLFHTAILFASQASLAASVYSVATKAPGTFTGSADHLVS
ncbi:MAG: glyoxalase [Microbacteriaceae bacterium]|nr:glyoxalase [Microbacteriaceae bacterium]